MLFRSICAGSIPGAGEGEALAATIALARSGPIPAQGDILHSFGSWAEHPACNSPALKVNQVKVSAEVQIPAVV